MTLELPKRTEIDRPVPGDPVARAEELIIKEARRRHRRRMIAKAGVATLVIAGLATGVLILARHRSSGTLSSPLPTRPGYLTPTGSRCQSGQLKVTSLSGGFGMGQTDEVIGFLNVSKASCTLVGYPVVVALDAHGDHVATARPMLDGIGGIHSGATAPPTVTLEPGQSASATIEGDSHPSGSATSCPSYSSFLVTPPGWTRSINMSSWRGNGSPGPFPGCIPIAITPIVPGDSGALPATQSPVQTPAASTGGSTPATVPSRGGSAPTTTP
jgi:hypothetical protein